MDADPQFEPIVIDPNKEPRKTVMARFTNGLDEAAAEIVRGITSDSVSRLNLDCARYVIEYVMGGGVGSKGVGESSSAEALEELRQTLDLMPETEELDG